MSHLSSFELCLFLDDALVGTPDDRSARHLATCAICRARYEAWSHVDDSLRELLGEVPDEHAMEQRTSWVEIAVAAERKGLPAPEFAELRIPLDAPLRPAAQVFSPSPPYPPPAGAHPRPAGPQPPPAASTIPDFIPSPGLAHLFAPPPPAPPAPPRQTLPPRPTVMRPVLHAPTPAPAAPAAAPARGPAPARGVAPPPAAPAPVAVASAPPEPAPGGRNQSQQGYAKMPRAPRKGFMSFVTRPGLWIALALVAALATGLPLGVKKFGIPEIKFDFRPPRERAADVHKAAAGIAEERDAEAVPRKPRGATTHTKAAPKDDESPDASVIFDLPALEPEDGEPDPGDEPAPSRSTRTADRGTASGSRGDPAMICGDVRNLQGAAIEGARVYLAVPPRMVHTDGRGHFCIVCPPGTRTLRIEATGRAKVTRTLEVGRGRLETRFTLNAAN